VRGSSPMAGPGARVGPTVSPSGSGGRSAASATAAPAAACSGDTNSKRKTWIASAESGLV
jgi:hypothetical protein